MPRTSPEQVGGWKVACSARGLSGFSRARTGVGWVLGLVMTAWAGAAQPTVLTNLAEIHGHLAAGGPLGAPVRAAAVVTYADLPWNLLFLQDETGTLFQIPRELGAEPVPGDRVEVTGVTLADEQGGLGQFQLRSLGPGELPQPQRAGEKELLSGIMASRWLEVEGVIRDVAREEERLRLTLVCGKTRLPSYVRRGSAAVTNLEAWVGARVRVHGVCANRMTDNRVSGAGLMIPDLSHVQVLERPAAGLSAYPVLPIAQVRRSEDLGERTPRVRVSGVVVARRNASLTVRDDTGSITVIPRSGQPARLYDRVEVWGFPSAGRQEIRLVDAIWELSTEGGSAAAGERPAPAPGFVLRTVREVRELSREQAAARLPVRLEGTVTYADAAWHQFFLQDDTGALYVQGWQEGLTAGRRVRVEGVTEPGLGAHMVINPTVQVLGEGQMPAPVRLELKELGTVARDCAWVELDGVVRQVDDLPAHARLRMVNADGSFEAVIQGVGDGGGFRSYFDAAIRVRGVNTVVANDRGELTGVQLRVPGGECLELLLAAPADPFALECRRIGAVRDTQTALLGLQRIHIQGVVTLITADGGYTVQDETGALWVRSSEPNAVEVGDGVEVVGFPDLSQSTTELSKALFRPNPTLPAVQPRRVRPHDLLGAIAPAEGRGHWELVEMEGRLRADGGGPERRPLVVESGGVVFTAEFEPRDREFDCPVFLADSQVRLTGVCSVRVDDPDGVPGLTLFLRGASDVVVLRDPPAWTMLHTVFLGVGLLVVVLTAMGVGLLRRQVRLQTRQIRQRLESEAALEKHFTLVWETSVDGMRMTDAQGTVIKVNEAYCRLVQRKRSELEGQPLTVANEESGRPRLLAQYCEAFQSGMVPASQEYEMVLWNGRRVWFELANSFLEQPGGPTLLLSQFRDVTGRKHAEEERERLMLAIEQAAEIILITDAKGNIQYANPTFETITGYTRAEAIGQNLRLLKSGRHDDAFYRAMWATLLRGQTWSGRLVNRRKDGSLYTEEATISPVRDATGRIVNFVAAKRDITREIRLEDQLLHSQKMESVGRLAGGVAHDFNNMLSVILGQTEMALEQLDPAQPLHADLLEIRQAAKRSADLTRQLLTFARKQTVAPVVLDLNDTVDGMLKMIRRLIGEDIALLWVPGHSLRPVKVDPAQIDQILANLCVNARDAIAGVGQVTIETRNVRFDPAACAEHPGMEPGEYVTIAVTDTGCGMSQEIQAHLFEPFFSTKGVGKGTGLGLATVYGAVKQNRGFVDVQSEPGRGTTFRIHLPAHANPPDPSGNHAVEATTPRGHETILLVEDEPSILKLGQRLLESLGYTVLPAGTPTEAIDLARRHTASLRLLITDVVMPEMNGRDLARQLVALQPNLKVLFMSGYPADVIANRGVLEGGVHFVQKPFSKSDLAARARAALDAA